MEALVEGYCPNWDNHKQGEHTVKGFVGVVGTPQNLLAALFGGHEAACVCSDCYARMTLSAHRPPLMEAIGSEPAFVCVLKLQGGCPQAQHPPNAIDTSINVYIDDIGNVTRQTENKGVELTITEVLIL